MVQRCLFYIVFNLKSIFEFQKVSYENEILTTQWRICGGHIKGAGVRISKKMLLNTLKECQYEFL